MKINYISRIILISFNIFLTFWCAQINAQTNVVTQHNDLYRTGWNNTETILNTKNVRTGLFGKLFSRPVDNQIYAQLLVVKDVNISGYGIRNVVYATTVNNTIYAYDADSVNVVSPYWQVNLNPTGLRPVKNTDLTGACGGNYKDFSGNIGIVGTPVIDPATGTIYVVARSCATDGTGFVQYLHALDVTTGNERPNSPKLISGQITGTGTGAIGGILYFDAQKENQRCGLLLLNGIVYVCYASHCDWGPYHGWVFGYDETTLQQTILYNTTPYGSNGGIWMSGSAPSADSSGNIYVSVGNGSAGYSGDMTDLRNRSESALKLTPSGSTLMVSSYFTPTNYTTLEGSDLDFGSTELMLIPNTNRGVTACKDGKIYLLDRDNMGGYNSGSNNVVQTIDLGTNAHLRSSFAYYKGSQKEYIYSWSENALLKAFPYNRTLNNFDVANTVSSGVQGPTGNSGAFLSVSSNGSVDSTAVLWATFAANGDANQSTRPGILHAFDATDVTKELWNSSQDTADIPGNYAKFNCPTIANGKVYLATFSNKFIVYGLTGNSADTCNSFNIALNKPATASSTYSTFTPDRAFDGDPTTEWSSVGGVDPQYIYVDLGGKFDLCRVSLLWQASYGKDFTIDVSDDAVTWTTIATVTNNTNLSNNIPLKGSGRYVRMNGTARGTSNGYSLYSFEVYGTPNAGDCPAPDSLSTSDIFENTTTIHWKSTGAANYSVQYKAVTSSNWTTVSVDTNMAVLNNLACGTDYLFKVQSICNTTDTSLYSNSSSFSQLACGSNCNPLPTRWTTQDIGNTDIPGSACYTPDVFTLNGSGDDVGNTADAFRFAQKTLAGDGEFDARILSMDNSNPANKCGIMIRETLAAGSKCVFVALTSGSGATFQYRSATDGNTIGVNTTTTIVPPYWVRLIKTGTVYSAQISPDGTNYSAIGSFVDAGFGANPVYAGLAITSHDNTILSTGQVDNYLFTSGEVLPLKLLSFNANLNLRHSVNLKWSSTQEMNTDYFVIERSSSDYNFVAIDSVKAINNGPFTATYNATDNFPMGGINFYRLKIVDINGNISYSALVMVRLNNAKAPSLYPNPAKTIVNIIEGTDPVKYISIYDISGKALIRLNNAGVRNTIKVSTSNLMRGTYIVEITTATGIYSDKLLIQ